MFKYLDNIKNDKIEVRLTKSDAEVVAAQRLRYKIFFEEEGAKPSLQVRQEKRDFDEFDGFCDHLIAIDRNAGDNPDDYVIGTYRLMKRENAKRCGKWYSQAEFNVEKFNEFDGEILELGRSCVHPLHRTKLVMQMMWNALAAYMFEYDIKLMFGCGSWHGVNPDEYRQALSYIYYNCLTKDINIVANGENARDFNPLPRDEVNEKVAMAQLPSMTKGYLRAGAKIGSQIYIDWDFNCFDLCIIFEMKDLKTNYLKHYENELKK